MRIGDLPTVLRFAMAGSVGFIVDAGVLAALVHFAGANPFVARAVSFPTAVTTTWYINRRLTFAASASSDRMSEWGRYFAVSLVGSGVNICVYSLCVYLSDMMFRFPVLALAVASIVALVVNYHGANRHAFRA